MSIHQWPLGERPRERLLKHGPGILSDAELLAILLRHGSKGRSAVDIARQLLNRFQGLRGIFSATSKTLCQEYSLGPAKYAQFQAAAELGRRHLRETMQNRHVIMHSQDAQNFMIANLRDYPHEVFAGLFLDNKHRIIEYEHLFHGTIHSAAIYPREVVKRALHHNAAAMIVAHNHPSGVPEPSDSDTKITRQLQKALALIEVKLLDHLIIGDNIAVSLAERGCFLGLV